MVRDEDRWRECVTDGCGPLGARGCAGVVCVPAEDGCEWGGECGRGKGLVPEKQRRGSIRACVPLRLYTK